MIFLHIDLTELNNFPPGWGENSLMNWAIGMRKYLEEEFGVNYISNPNYKWIYTIHFPNEEEKLRFLLSYS